MSPRDWLLLLFQDADRPIDRVRVQKAMFLFSQRSQAPDPEKYSFVPYKYGPFSFQIYPDLDTMVAEGLLTAEPFPRVSSPGYKLATKGQRVAASLVQEVPAKRLELLTNLRTYVLERDFESLLNDIYRLYPTFAVRSVFR